MVIFIHGDFDLSDSCQLRHVSVFLLYISMVR